MQFLLSKYVARLGIALAIWLFFKLSNATTLEEMASFGAFELYYIIFTIGVTFLEFGIIDLVKRLSIKKWGNSFDEPKHLTLFAIFSFLLCSLTVIPFMYTLEFTVKPFIGALQRVDPQAEVAKDIMASLIFAAVVITGYVIQALQNKQRKMALIQAELNSENMAMKYSALKNQLSPHFLFNSFSVLTSLIYQNQDTASDFIAQLSKIHRYVLDNKEHDVVTLHKELDFIQSYLFLMKIRHEDSIHTCYTIEVNQHQCYIPTLSLQLLVENAIKHTAFSEKNPLVIELFTEDTHTLVVRNNLNKRHAQKAIGTHTGLDNIKKRYALLGAEEP